MSTLRYRFPAATRLGIWVLSVGVFFLIWQIVGASGQFFAITPPTEVIPVMVDESLHGELIPAVLDTLSKAAVGLILGILVGVPVGLLVATARWAEWSLDPLINAGFATPLVILLPIVGLYMGLTFSAKVFVAFTFCVFVMAISTASGVRSVSPSLRQVGQAFCLSRREVATKVVLPAASPQVITGMRISVSRAVQGAVLADLLLEADGLGLYLINAGGTFDISQLLAGILAITVVAAGLMSLAQALENRLLRWSVDG